jgi:SAM-dependent methyltransferase
LSATTIAGVPEPEPSPRYDQLAEGYEAHWGPVIRPAAEAVLEHVPGEARGTDVPRDVLDIGAGTGTLSIAAIRRWPRARVSALDVSAAMLEIAEREARRLPPADASRLTTVTAPADRLPFGDGVFDVAVSSFVLQLVPSRKAALREARRVLRPGGRLAWVAWLVGGERFAADRVVDDVLDEFGFDPPEIDQRSGDLASVAAAADATRRAGFSDVRATAGELAHHWTPEAYGAFIAEFDEESLFSDLAADERTEIETKLLAGLRDLSGAELTMRLPLVYVSGRAR